MIPGRWHGIRNHPEHSSLQGKRVNPEKRNGSMCSICNERAAVIECDGCQRPLCKKCRSIEIWRSPGKEVSIRYFCPQCRDDAGADKGEKGTRVFGLGQVTDMVNQEQTKANRFKIKLKI